MEVLQLYLGPKTWQKYFIQDHKFKFEVDNMHLLQTNPYIALQNKWMCVHHPHAKRVSSCPANTTVYHPPLTPLWLSSVEMTKQTKYLQSKRVLKPGPPESQQLKSQATESEMEIAVHTV